MAKITYSYPYHGGKLKSRRTWKNGKLIVEEGWYENEDPWFITHWKNGKQHGLDQGWHENKVPKYRSMWKNGKRVGVVEGWYGNGVLSHRSNWKDGKQDGLDEGWYFTGVLEHKSNWKDGQEEVYVKNGELKKYDSVYDILQNKEHENSKKHKKLLPVREQ